MSPLFTPCAQLREHHGETGLREVEHRLLDLLADAVMPGIRVESHLRAVLLDQRGGLASARDSLTLRPLCRLVLVLLSFVLILFIRRRQPDV